MGQDKGIKKYSGDGTFLQDDKGQSCCHKLPGLLSCGGRGGDGAPSGSRTPVPQAPHCPTCPLSLGVCPSSEVASLSASQARLHLESCSVSSSADPGCLEATCLVGTSWDDEHELMAKAGPLTSCAHCPRLPRPKGPPPAPLLTVPPSSSDPLSHSEMLLLPPWTRTLPGVTAAHGGVGAGDTGLTPGQAEPQPHSTWGPPQADPKSGTLVQQAEPRPRPRVQVFAPQPAGVTALGNGLFTGVTKLNVCK